MGRATCNVIIAGLYLGDTSWHDINQTGCLIGPRRERNNPEDLTLANDVQAGAIGAPDSCQTGAPVPNAFLESFCFAKHSQIFLKTYTHYMCYRKGPVSRPPGGGFRAQHTRGVSGGARAVENVPRGIPSPAPQSASRQHHRGSVWAIPGRSDGGTSDPCTQWTDLARFDERGGGIGASGPSSTPHYGVQLPLSIWWRAASCC